MDALDLADGLVPLATLTPPGVTNHKRWINRWMYCAERSALMHAKPGQNYLLPHDAADRAELIESLGRLWRYIKELIEKHLQVRRHSSSLSRCHQGHFFPVNELLVHSDALLHIVDTLDISKTADYDQHRYLCAHVLLRSEAANSYSSRGQYRRSVAMTERALHDIRGVQLSPRARSSPTRRPPR
jgi:hypothetical protein